MPDWHDFSKTSSLVNRLIWLQITWNFAISWRKCVFKLRYSLSTFLTNFSLNPKDQWLHCQEQFPAAASQKWNIRCEKYFNATRACSNDAKVTLPGQTDLAWVQLLPHQISLNFKIVCHLAELDGVPKFAENADAINFCKPSILVCFSKPLPDPWLLAFTYRLDLAEFAESSNLAKMLIKTNFHCLQKILCIKWNVLPLCTLSLPMGSCIYPQTGSGGSLRIEKLRQKCRSRQFSPGMRTLTSQICWSVSQKSWLTFSWPLFT